MADLKCDFSFQLLASPECLRARSCANGGHVGKPSSRTPSVDPRAGVAVGGCPRVYGRTLGQGEVDCVETFGEHLPGFGVDGEGMGCACTRPRTGHGLRGQIDLEPITFIRLTLGKQFVDFGSAKLMRAASAPPGVG